VRLAKSFLDGSQIEEAKRAYEKALELDPLQLEGRRGLFKTKVYEMAVPGQQDTEVIRKRLEWLLAIDPKDAHALTMLGNLYTRAGLGREEAIAKYRQALEIDPALKEEKPGLGIKIDGYLAEYVRAQPGSVRCDFLLPISPTVLMILPL
jgi:tetratricopeptide (TPR) repeat protein